jgi:putative endonuclease
MEGAYVYILASKSGVLYIGVTSRLDTRFIQHKLKLIKGFSTRYRTNRLVYFERFEDVRAAIAREKQLKGWIRAKKISLIESLNPSWSDLSEYMFPPTSAASSS